MLERLERLEAVLLPLTERLEAVSKTIMPKQNGIVEALDSFMESTGKQQEQKPVMNFMSSSNTGMMGNEMISERMLMMSDPINQLYIADNSLYASQPFLSTNLYTLNNPYINQQLQSASIFEASNLLDMHGHLVMLGLAYNIAVPLSTAQLKHLFSADHSLLNIPNPIQDALAAMGAMYSSHPDLCMTMLPPAMLDRSLTQTNRIYVARKYLLRARKAVDPEAFDPATLDQQDSFLVQTSGEPMSECDTIRVMLILATVYYGLGDGGDSMKLISDAYKLAQKAKVYESSLAVAAAPLDAASVDSLVSILPKFRPDPHMERTEMFDRQALWAACLVVDTYSAMASGFHFGIDETDYAKLVSVLDSNDPYLIERAKDMASRGRIYAANLGEDTIWQNCSLAVMLDDVSEISRLTMLASSGATEYGCQVRLMVLQRQVMRYARSKEIASFGAQKSDPLARVPQYLHFAFSNTNSSLNTAQLHESLLEWLDHFPVVSRPFMSLETFADQQEGNAGGHWRFNILVIQSIFTFLSAFSYLHLPLANPDTGLYALASTKGRISVKRHSSRAVLLACFKALTFMIRILYTPTTTADSPFKQAIYDEERLQFCMSQEPSTEIPSPALCWTIQSLTIFIISSSCLTAFKDQPQYDSIVRSTKTLIIPCLERTSRLWPMSFLYSSKLHAMVQSSH